MKSFIERLFLIVSAAALVIALSVYLPLGFRAAAVESARDEDSTAHSIPSVYYSRASAGFDDSLVSFDDIQSNDEAAEFQTAAPVERGKQPELDPATHRADEEAMPFADPLIP